MSTIKPNAQMFFMFALGLIMTVIVTFLSCKPAKDTHVASLQSVSWLQGRWTSSLEGQFENFVLIDSNLIERVIYQIEDGQPVISERGKIFESDASLAMTTTIFNTQENEFSKFELIGQTFNEIIFRNIQTGDPYSIKFQLNENGKLNVTESDQSGKKLNTYELSKHDLP